MRESLDAPRWTRHLAYRTEHTRTTWKFRFGFVGLVVVMMWLTHGWWAAAVARSLVCDANAAPSDAILVENFDNDYLVYERAANLRRAGLAARVLIPVLADSRTSELSDVAVGIAQVMARISRMGPVDFVPIQVVEPISLNASSDVLRFIERERIRSVIVVAPLFRSRRSALVYTARFGRAGVTVTCDPAGGTHRLDTWTQSWHGIEDVLVQGIKLLYYRLYVLPFHEARASAAARSAGMPASEAVFSHQRDARISSITFFG